VFRFKRLAAVFVAAGAVALASTAGAFADSATVTATVTGGSLSESTASTPSVSATLNGTDQAKTYTMVIDMNDPTGTGNGWNLTITSTTFTTGGGSPKTLSTTASSVTGVVSACKQGTCTAPTNAITYSFSVPAAATAPTAVKLFNAAANTGMGEFNVTPTVSVAIPANTYAGTYTSTVTLAVVSGP
jgi:hypothetical protein